MKRYSEERLTLGLLSLSVLGGTLLLSVEPQVLEEEDLSVGTSLDGSLSLGSNTVGEEGDGDREERLELGGLDGRTTPRRGRERSGKGSSEGRDGEGGKRMGKEGSTHDRLEGVLLNDVTVRSSEVGHEDDGSGT